MNRINPLHIALFLFVLLAFFSFQLSEAKSELSDIKELSLKTQSLATQVSGLKAVYANKNMVKKALSRVLSHSFLRESNIIKRITQKGIKLSSLSMDAKALNFLIGKILNGSFNITSLQIKKLSEKRVSLEMEVRW